MFALGFVMIPAFMIVVSLVTSGSLNRRLNIGASVIYIAAVIVGCIGETWIYYLVGSFFEVVPLLGIAKTAWSWKPAS